MTTSKLKSILQVAAVLSTIGGFSLAQAGAVVVNFDVNGDQSKLIATTQGSCQKNNAPGCVRASGNTQINFNLTGPSNCALDHVALGAPGNISAVAASDFNADMSSGVVTPLSSSANHILIRDNNTDVYDIAYTVYANCNGVMIDSDPRVENDGSGNP
jgi:hypothetical protein